MLSLRRVRAEASALRRFGRPSPVPEQVPAHHDAFWAEVRRLPKRQSQVIALFYFDRLSVKEIGEVLQVAEGTVKSSLHQGRTRLARQLKAKGRFSDEP